MQNCVGTIPSTIGSLVHLNTFYVDTNSLTGNINYIYTIHEDLNSIFNCRSNSE